MDFFFFFFRFLIFPLLYHSKSEDISSECICYNVQCNPKLQEIQHVLIPHFIKGGKLHLSRCCFKSEITILHKHDTVTIACALLSSEVPVYGDLGYYPLLKGTKHFRQFQEIQCLQVLCILGKKKHFRCNHEVGAVLRVFLNELLHELQVHRFHSYNKQSVNLVYFL